ncbi:unnamed protein product, partial [marine sediment metagenome]
TLIGQAVLAMETPLVLPGYAIALLRDGLAAWLDADRDIDDLAPALRLAITYLDKRECFIVLNRDEQLATTFAEILDFCAGSATSNDTKKAIDELTRRVNEATISGKEDSTDADVRDES